MIKIFVDPQKDDITDIIIKEEDIKKDIGKIDPAIPHFPVVFISPSVTAMRKRSSADGGGGANELLIDRWSQRHLLRRI